MNLRAIAALIIYQVAFEGKSLSDCLATEVQNIKNPKDKALVKAICFGVLRKYYYYEFLANYHLEKPFKEKDRDLTCLIMVGLYQLLEMRIPEHAAVSETVSGAAKLKKPWAKSLVNAILRNIDKEKIAAINSLTKEAYYNHPMWMQEKFKSDWPSEFDMIMQTNNAHPPLTLRVNLHKTTLEKYISNLSSKGINATPIKEVPSGLILEKPVDVTQLPGFKEGLVSVQDGAAQFAASLLKLEPNLRVLDACAAPGGKTSHILEMQPEVDLVAIDNKAERLSMIEDNLNRLKLSAKLIVADAADTEKWWDGNKFDRVLLDVPCSGTGVIRRHPDIKVLRRKEDIENLNAEQKKLLEKVWQVLKPGGLLVYATCSIFPEENCKILEDFISRHNDAFEIKIKEYWGKDCEIGKQILPGMMNLDGFYYGCLRKL